MHNSFKQYLEEGTFYQRHFFDVEFFMQQFKKEVFRFEDMMHEMNSLRNLYLKEIYPDYKKEQDIKPQKEITKGIIQI